MRHTACGTMREISILEKEGWPQQDKSDVQPQDFVGVSWDVSQIGLVLTLI